MKAKWISLACGVATESLLFGLMIVAGGGIGPCGPTGSGFAGIVMLLHIPVLWLAMALDGFGVPTDVSAALLVMAPVIYVLLWSSIWYLFWKRKFTTNVRPSSLPSSSSRET
jgi:hypothetical protein